MSLLPAGALSDFIVDNSVIGMIVIACIALLGILLFCFEFMFERNKRNRPKR
jgi:hypothetical protein